MELDRRNYSRAIQTFIRASHLDPQNAAVLDSLANAYDVVGDAELATDTIDRAIPLAVSEPERTRYRRRRAQIRGDTGREVFYLRRGYQLEPEEAFWSFKLGWFYFTHRRDCVKSGRHFARAYELEPDPNTLSYWGESLFACGEASEAEEILDRYATEVPHVADASDLLATLYARTGRYAQAETAYRRAMEIDGGFHEARLHLGVLFPGDRSPRCRGTGAREGPRGGRVAESPRPGVCGGFPAAPTAGHAGRRGGERPRGTGLEAELGAGPAGSPASPPSRLETWWEAERWASEIRALPALADGGSDWEREYLLDLEAEIAVTHGRIEEAVARLRRALEMNPPERALFECELAVVYLRSGLFEESAAAFGAGPLALNPPARRRVDRRSQSRGGASGAYGSACRSDLLLERRPPGAAASGYSAVALRTSTVRSSDGSAVSAKRCAACRRPLRDLVGGASGQPPQSGPRPDPIRTRCPLGHGTPRCRRRR